MIMLPELKKPSKLHYVFFGVTTIWLMLVSIFLLIEHHSLSELVQASQNDTKQIKMQALQSRQNEFDDQLRTVEEVVRTFQTRSDNHFQAYTSAVNQRLSDLNAQLNSTLPDLVAIHERLNVLDEQVRQLAKTLQRLEPTIQHSSSKPAQSIPKPQSLPAPTLMLLGAEIRGGERLLSVAPANNPSLSAVRLLRIGEKFDDWLLHDFDAHVATFNVQGQIRKLSLP